MGSSIIFLCVASLLLVGSINANLHELNLDTREHQVRQASTSASITTSTTTGNSTGVLPNTTSVTLTVYYNGTTNTGCLVCGNSTYTCSPDKNWINYTIPEFRVGEYQKYQIIKTITVLAAGVNVVKDDENAENSPSLTFYLIDSLNRSTYLFSQFAAYDSETCQSTCQSILKPKDSDYQQMTMAPTGSFKIAMTTQSFSFCASYISIKIGLALGDQPIVITNGLGIGSTSGSSPAPDSAFSGDSIKIILGVIGGLIVLVILIAVIIVIARRVKDKKDKKYKEQHPMIDMNTKRSQSQIVGDNLYAPISIFKDDIKGVNKIDDIEVLDKLGAGNFGEVYRGVWQGTTFVALKRLTGDLHEFVKEASTLMRLNHPNIVRMLGVHSNPNGEYIVTEFMSLGSVDKFLQKRRLGLSDLLSLCHQAASGMNYLEKEKLVHRDLAARNLLVAEEGNKFTVKVADFGLSRTTTEGIYEAQGGQFPIKWSALECLQYRIFTSQSDVWSFGICLWEIFSFGMMPYLAWDNETTVTNIMKGYRLEQPEACPPEVYEIMLNCWKVDAAQRPTFRELFDSLFLLHRASENPELQQAPVQQEQV